MSHTVYIAIGANIGDRIKNIHAALDAMTAEGIHITSTGFLYESEPMYVEDQPRFLNTCIGARTDLARFDLLFTLKSIETRLGRDKTIRNGPRNIDLDILFYDNEIVNTEALEIPHPRMSERAFVLLPLNDMIPSFLHPAFRKTVRELLIALNDSDSCRRVIPTGLNDSVIASESKSVIVGILNVTPDSFSDGGLYTGLEAAVERAKEMAAQGTDIIDIGGESTRPSAEQVEESEEQKRVIAVIKRVRSELPGIPISIDTYRASTARAAVTAGASIVNDVSGGMLDGEMLSTVAQLKKPFICTHAGQIGKHSIIDHQDGNPSILDSSMKSEDIVRIVRSQISSRVDACIAAGIPRWNLILDPGLGFGKSGAVNFTLLKRLEDVFSGSLEGFPVMIGASRKRFVRDLKNDGQSWSNTEYEAMVGTAAVTAASIAQSQRAQFHRLHDVGEMRRVVDICDRIFRSRE
jgi:dihydroneopterin aldolase/2-amino-4-hydroxy-6-hydroxymethyldihydropteridine diphosphokinase/dihydropteroate synthase/2-amino-4-hydroxy-6-hydroxymethyldihydropteridine diphosphokinase/dihydropteroate synthase